MQLQSLLQKGRNITHVTPLLFELHWLPIEDRIIFKILLIAYKSLFGKGPAYLKELLQFRKTERDLRSSDAFILDYPRTNLKTYGDRAFSIIACIEWNKLPMLIRSSESVASFKTQLKTHFFLQN